MADDNSDVFRQTSEFRYLDSKKVETEVKIWLEIKINWYKWKSRALSLSRLRSPWYLTFVIDASVHSQVIIATQSPQLIDGFSLDSIVVLEQDDETKSTVAHKLDKERLKEWIEEYTVSELWRKNVIGGQPL